MLLLQCHSKVLHTSISQESQGKFTKYEYILIAYDFYYQIQERFLQRL